MSSQDRIKALKHEYGQGGAGWPVEGKGLHGYDSFNARGLRFQWRDDEGEKEGLVPWSEIEKEIGKLIQENSYITSEELAKYIDTSNSRKLIIKFGYDENSGECYLIAKSTIVIRVTYN